MAPSPFAGKPFDLLFGTSFESLFHDIVPGPRGARLRYDRPENSPVPMEKKDPAQRARARQRKARRTQRKNAK